VHLFACNCSDQQTDRGISVQSDKGTSRTNYKQLHRSNMPT
jgi:hypothetical protein